jgi:hypothetical protein
MKAYDEALARAVRRLEALHAEVAVILRQHPGLRASSAGARAPAGKPKAARARERVSGARGLAATA